MPSPHSSELSPIKHLWREGERDIGYLDSQPLTLLENAIYKAWYQISCMTDQHFVRSMSIINAVLQAKVAFQIKINFYFISSKKYLFTQKSQEILV